MTGPARQAPAPGPGSTARRIVLADDDPAYEFGPDYELPGRYALVVNEAVELVARLDVLVALAHYMLALAAAVRIETPFRDEDIDSDSETGALT